MSLGWPGQFDSPPIFPLFDCSYFVPSTNSCRSAFALSQGFPGREIWAANRSNTNS
jgi:hypothetical protein